MSFWEACDIHERDNGRVFTEIQVAIPRELTTMQRVELIRDFVNVELGERFVYTVAIHNPPAMDGGEQPHAHIMFSTRELDGIDRSKELFFKRANSKQPDLGGTKKSREWSKDDKENDRLQKIRMSWEELANQALAKAKLDIRIDARSLEAQGISDRMPEPKLGAVVTQMLKRGQETEHGARVLDIRDYRKEVNKLKEQEETAQDLKGKVLEFRRSPGESPDERKEKYDQVRSELQEFAKSEPLFKKTLGKFETLPQEEITPTPFPKKKFRPIRNRLELVGKNEEETPQLEYQRTLDLALSRHIVGNSTEYRWKKHQRIAFVDRGSEITFESKNKTAIKAGLQLAQEKGWSAVVLRGSKEFRREAWYQAQLLGIKTQGYRPTQSELSDLKKEQDEIRQKQEARRAEQERLKAVTSQPPLEFTQKKYLPLKKSYLCGFGPEVADLYWREKVVPIWVKTPDLRGVDLEIAKFQMEQHEKVKKRLEVHENVFFVLDPETREYAVVRQGLSSELTGGELAKDMREFVIKPLEKEKERLRKAIGAVGWQPELRTKEQVQKIVYEREYKTLTKGYTEAQMKDLIWRAERDKKKAEDEFNYLNRNTGFLTKTFSSSFAEEHDKLLDECRQHQRRLNELSEVHYRAKDLLESPRKAEAMAEEVRSIYEENRARERTRKELSDKHEVVSDTARRLEDLCQKFELVKDKSFTVSVAEYKVEGVKALTPHAIVPRDNKAFEEAVEQAQKLQQAQKRGRGMGFGF